MSDHRFLQTGFDKQLSCLIEELDEVVTAAGLHLNEGQQNTGSLNTEMSDVMQA